MGVNVEQRVNCNTDQEQIVCKGYVLMTFVPSVDQIKCLQNASAQDGNKNVASDYETVCVCHIESCMLQSINLFDILNWVQVNQKCNKRISSIQLLVLVHVSDHHILKENDKGEHE